MLIQPAGGNDGLNTSSAGILWRLLSHTQHIAIPEETGVLRLNNNLKSGFASLRSTGMQQLYNEENCTASGHWLYPSPERIALPLDGYSGNTGADTDQYPQSTGWAGRYPNHQFQLPDPVSPMT